MSRSRNGLAGQDTETHLHFNKSLGKKTAPIEACCLSKYRFYQLIFCNAKFMDNACFCLGLRGTKATVGNFFMLYKSAFWYPNSVYWMYLFCYSRILQLNEILDRTNNITTHCCWESSKSIILTTTDTADRDGQQTSSLEDFIKISCLFFYFNYLYDIFNKNKIPHRIFSVHPCNSPVIATYGRERERERMMLDFRRRVTPSPSLWHSKDSLEAVGRMWEQI